MKDIQKKIRPAEGYLITSAANVQYLTHFTGTNGTVLLTKKKAFLITDARYARVGKKILPRNVELVIMSSFKEEMPKLLKKLRTKKLNFESLDVSVEKHRQLKKLLKGIKLEASTTFIESFREVKNREEIKWIRESQRINEKTFQAVTKQLKTGKSEKQVAWEIEKIGREMGADGISFDPIVAFGSNSGSPHHMNTTRKLKKGDMVLIDMGMKFKGYCSDMTRTLFTKKPTPKQEKIYQIVLQAQKASIQKLKAGIKGSAADKIARDIIEKAGKAEKAKDQKKFGYIR